MTSSKEYWRKREEQHIAQMIRDEQKMKKAIAERFQNAIDNINKEIDANWSRFVGKEGISLSEAKKISMEMDVKAFARKAKKYVKEKDFSQTANDELRLYNVTMRINRLELLKSQIGLELVALSDDLDKYTADMLTKEGIAEATRQAGILGETIFDGYKGFIDTVVNGSFHSATFSQRIWGNMQAFKADLDKLLVQTVTQGKNPRDMARKLRNLYDANKYEAERLMRTESARVQTEIQKQSYLKYDIEEYEFIAEPSACPICAALNGKILKVKDMSPGINSCPMHANCRCSTAPYVERSFNTDWTNYASGLNTSVSDAINTAHAEVLSYGKRTGNELMKLFDRNTGKQLLSETGGEDFVDYTDEILQVLKNSEPKSIILSHNHPAKYNASFSKADILQLIKHDSIDLLTLVTRDATQYSLQKGSEKIGLLKKIGYDSYYEKVLQKKIKKYGEKEELWSKIVDETNKEVAKKYRLKYRKVDD